MRFNWDSCIIFRHTPYDNILEASFNDTSIDFLTEYAKEELSRQDLKRQRKNRARVDLRKREKEKRDN